MTGDRTPGLRERLGEVLREKFHWWITAEWICCEPLAKGHKLCKKGNAAREMVASLLADDPEQHPQTSPILDAVLPVVEAESAAYRELLGTIWLYVDWRYVTRQLTTEQKELWADAVETTSDPEDPVTADRWWRE